MSNPSKKADQNGLRPLIRKAQKGDQAAFEVLLDRYAPLIDAMLGQFASSSHFLQEADDLRQEAVLCFYKALMHFDVEQDQVQFGLYAKECIRNGLISNLRSLKKHGNTLLLEDGVDSVVEPSEETDPAQRLMDEETYLALSRRIREVLSPYENRVWWLYVGGRTAKEIGRMMGKDERSVQNAVYRIRRKLRTVISYP